MTENIISWESAAATAARLTPAGPKLSRKQAGAAVESIRYSATASVDHVHRITGLDAAKNLHDSEVLVVDRGGWSRANSQTFAMMMNRLLQGGMAEKIEAMSAVERKATAAGAAVELGGVLAFLSSKVLGQYDPFAALGGFGASGGRLMLVAPNIVMLERELNLDPEDFRLWVCLHEQTHRVQFAAAPWLRDHMIDLISRLPESIPGGGQQLVERLLDGAATAVKGAAQRAIGANSPDADDSSGGGRHAAPRNPVTALLDKDSARVFSQLTAIMSLMEGHANVVMDAVDSSIVPTVKTIRRRFDTRPKKGFLDQIIRKALGMDLKMRQYRDGQIFVRHVVDARGMEQFNRIWEGLENLPTEDEIHAPDRWISRVLDGETPGTEPSAETSGTAATFTGDGR